MPAARFERVDALRGAAMVWMAVFHFLFDVNHFGFMKPRQAFFHDPFWTTQRSVILGTFLFTAGVSLAITMARGQTWPGFMRRWLQVVACAALVSLATWVVFPKAWVWFGVLHGMAVMLLLTRLLAPMGKSLALLGAVMLVVLPFFKTTGMEATVVRWLGMGISKPITQDWVPLVPWMGVMLIGFVVGQWALCPSTSVAFKTRAERSFAAGHVGPLGPAVLHASSADLLWRRLSFCDLFSTLITMNDSHPPKAREQSLYGFHAVGVRLRIAPETVREVHVDTTRRDARMRQFVERARAAGAMVVDSEDQRLSKLARNPRHQGVVAIVTPMPMRTSMDDVLDDVAKRGEQALVLVLDGVTDPHNLGACLRVADGAGAHLVIAPRDHAVGLNATVAKVASGAAEIDAVFDGDEPRALDVGAEGARAAGDRLQRRCRDDLYEPDLRGPVALVLGAEGAGLRQLTRKTCDQLVRIPMHGAVESLNVSVASAVCLYEAARQRGSP